MFLFAFLPVREAGLRFLLHADFEVVAGRDDLIEGSEWNAWLCLMAAEVFRDAVNGTLFASHSTN